MNLSCQYSPRSQYLLLPATTHPKIETSVTVTVCFFQGASSVDIDKQCFFCAFRPIEKVKKKHLQAKSPTFISLFSLSILFQGSIGIRKGGKSYPKLF